MPNFDVINEQNCSENKYNNDGVYINVIESFLAKWIDLSFGSPKNDR